MSKHYTRTAHRARIGLVLMLLTIVAAGSFYVVQLLEMQGDAMRVGPMSNEPDYIVEGFSAVRMSPEGQPRYIVAGKRLIHRPLDDTADIHNPVVESLAPMRAPMRMRSDIARVENDMERVILAGKVDVLREQGPANERMTLRTESLVILPDEDVMHTKDRIDISVGTLKMSGTGMRANNATGKVEILKDTQISYPPRAR
jgi:lipopolysaccharide export system protein LptC